MTWPLPPSARRVLFQIGDVVRANAHCDAEEEEGLDRTLLVIAINTPFSSAGSFIQYTGIEPDGKRCTFANFYGMADGGPGPRIATEEERIAYQKDRRAYVERANAEYQARQAARPPKETT